MVKTGISAALLALVLVTSPFIFSSFKPVYAFHPERVQVSDEEDSNLFFPASEFERERRAPTAALEALSPNLTGEQISLADGSVSFALDELETFNSSANKCGQFN